MRSLVLLSGGLDSTVTAYSAKSQSTEVYFLSFDYGQLHKKELEVAKRTAEALGGSHYVIEMPLVQILDSSLLGRGEIPVEEGSSIPNTWVPQRNSIFLAIAFGLAESIGATSVHIGVNSLDYSGYPDCRPEFIEHIGKGLNLASKAFVESQRRIEIVTPLQYLAKADIIKLGLAFGVNFKDTWSCYRGGERACGRCPSCNIRLEGFKLVGIEDPIEYEDVLY